MSLYARIVVALAIAAVMGLVAYYIYKAGGDSREAAWIKRESDLNAKAAAEIKERSDKVRALEATLAAAMASISGAYQNGLQENERAKNAAIAAVRAGQRLFIDAKCEDRRVDVPDTATAASGRDGGARAELSVAASEFLVSLASEADAVTRQLGACQAALLAERSQGGMKWPNK